LTREGETKVCGIFGFALRKPLPLHGVFRILEKLETHKYPQEKTTLGGFGAGIAILLPDGSVLSEKVGKISDSPVASLSEIVKPTIRKASVLLAHVRMPSPEFMKTAQFRETTQPYVVEFDPDSTIISVHNGKMENYKELRAELGKEHVFESEKYELIDSEVIPHYFEEILEEEEDAEKALNSLHSAMQGRNALGMLQITKENNFLHFIHKEKTRGLTIWTNPKGEVIFSSRKEPLKGELDEVLARGRFYEKVSIAYGEDSNAKLTFPIEREIKA
jgi:glucosamine 6-phosphate synthetase-like amidotransferase/phosphosugar isomerase protein